MPRIRQVGFDLDGTLIPNTTVLLHLERKLHVAPRISVLVDGYESGRFDNSTVARSAARAFCGLSKAELQGQLVDVPLLADIGGAVARLQAQGIYCAISTVTFAFAAEAVGARYGFDSWNGIELEWDTDEVCTGRVMTHVEAEDKVNFMQACAEKVGCDLADSAFVGDSRSDLAVFGAVGLSIALNGTEAAVHCGCQRARRKPVWDRRPHIAGIALDPLGMGVGGFPFLFKFAIIES